MRQCAIAFVLALSFAAPRTAFCASTPTEAKALQAADEDKTAYTLPPEQLANAQANDRAGLITNFADSICTILGLILVLALGVAARMRDLAVRVSKNRWAQGFVFTLQFFFLMTLLDLPFTLYGHVLDLRYGMSVQSWPSVLADQGKQFVLAYVVGSLMVMLLFWVIRKSPRRWWFWFWIPAVAIGVFAVSIKPYVIDPLFDKFEPLAQTNPALVEKLEQVAQRGGVDIPPERMFLMKASNKVTTLNAYVTGLGASKRIVVWDTSISRGTLDEVAFIFGHELGHYVLGHVIQIMAFIFFLLLFEFWGGYQAIQILLRRYGARWRIASQDDWASLIVLTLVVSVLTFLTQPLRSTFSRGLEHDADVYGEEAVHGIVADPQSTAHAAFQLLGEAALRDPEPNPLVVFWYYSHPPTGWRAAFAKHYNPWLPGEAPKYFAR